jgi:hypothetical protein
MPNKKHQYAGLQVLTAVVILHRAERYINTDVSEEHTVPSSGSRLLLLLGCLAMNMEEIHSSETSAAI